MDKKPCLATFFNSKTIEWSRGRSDDGHDDKPPPVCPQLYSLGLTYHFSSAKLIVVVVRRISSKHNLKRMAKVNMEKNTRNKLMVDDEWTKMMNESNQGIIFVRRLWHVGTGADIIFSPEWSLSY